MFWTSILEGFKILIDIKILFAIVIYSLIEYLILKVTDPTDKYTNQINFSFKKMIVSFTLTSLLTGFTILVISPILSGQSFYSSIETLIPILPRLLGLVVISLIVLILFQFIPIIGKQVVNNPSVTIAIVGFIAYLIFIANPDTFQTLGLGLDNTKSNVLQAFPGFWVITGYIILAVLVSWIFLIPTTFIYKRPPQDTLYIPNKKLLFLEMYASIFAMSLGGIVVLQMAVFYFLDRLSHPS